MAATKDEKVAPGSAAPAATEPKEIPSFSKVAAESRDARSAELAELAGVAAPGKEKTADTPPVDDINAKWAALEEPLRAAIYDHASKEAQAHINGWLGKEYGDIMPLVPILRDDPNLRATLAAAAKDPELLDVLRDPRGREMLKDLSKKELREFLFSDAKQAYEKYATQNDAIAMRDGTKPDPRDERIAALEGRFETEALERESQNYIGDRRREIGALFNAFPDLKTGDGRKFFDHVQNVAEDRFVAAAQRAGIKTHDDKGNIRMAFPAEALRKGVKPPSYREMYEYLAEATGRAKMPAAPSTTTAVVPAPAQAPRTAAEGRQRGVEMLKSKGGFNSLARTRK